MNDVTSLYDSLLEFLKLVSELSLAKGLRNLNTATIKGFANLVELSTYNLSLLEDDDINCAEDLVGGTSVILKSGGIKIAEVS